MLVRLLALTATLLLVSCADPAEVEVVNNSGTVVADVIVIAHGATAIVGNLNPHQQRTVSICPSRDSTLEVRFIARGKERAAAARTYVECSSLYRVAVEIEPDFSVRTTYRKAPPGRR